MDVLGNDNRGIFIQKLDNKISIITNELRANHLKIIEYEGNFT